MPACRFALAASAKRQAGKLLGLTVPPDYATKLRPAVGRNGPTTARGGGGMGKDRHGANGKSIIMRVPAGTQIYEEDGETLLALLETHSWGAS